MLKVTQRILDVSIFGIGLLRGIWGHAGITPPVHGRNISQINRCIETYDKLGIQRIAFGSWGTSGPNGSVNMLSRSG